LRDTAPVALNPLVDHLTYLPVQIFASFIFFVEAMCTLLLRIEMLLRTRRTTKGVNDGGIGGGSVSGWPKMQGHVRGLDSLMWNLEQA
jgi:hypothetical protein